MRLKSALRRGVAAAVIAGIVVSSGIPAYAGTWDIADGDITVKAGDEGTNNVKQGDNDFVKDEGDTSSPANQARTPSPSTPPRAMWTSPSTT